MHADISRDTFAALRDRHFLRVLLQQGRPLVDADFNEQVAILLHYIETLATDLIGPFGGPKNNLGFKVITKAEDLFNVDENIPKESTARKERLKALLDKHDFLLSAGRYYVDGVLCENNEIIGYSEQLAYKELEKDTSYLVYLDVWERHISQWEDRQLDDDPRTPGIREVALGGVDTTTRTRVEWQVRTVASGNLTNRDIFGKGRDEWRILLGDRKVDVRPGSGRLMARTDPQIQPGAPDPCIQPPDAGYRGPENLLCRVEIHKPGKQGDRGATYKVSFMNGSVIFPIRLIQDALVTIAQVGEEEQRGLAEGNWVEVIEDGNVLRGEPGVLCKVVRIDQESGEVTLDKAPDVTTDLSRHPLLRRWDTFIDSTTKKITCEAAVKQGQWLNVGFGVQIQFDGQSDAIYRTGDYWLIPVRIATGDVEWPLKVPNDQRIREPLALPPQGVEHHYAPLALIKLNVNGEIALSEELSTSFLPFSGVIEKLP